MTILKNSLTSFEKRQIDRYVKREKATKMQYCGIRNGGWGHELALKLSLVGIKVSNYPLIIKYILYFEISLKKSTYQMYPLLPSNRRIQNIKKSNFHKCVVARQP